MKKKLMPSDIQAKEEGTTGIPKVVNHNTEVVDKGM
jgi:hypothetical protein